MHLQNIRQKQGPLSYAHPQSGSHHECEALIDVLGLSADALGAARSVMPGHTSSFALLPLVGNNRRRA